MANNTTIKDVALHAGVAISTVSRVLNGMDKVSEKTRKKVLSSVEALDYVPNNIAVSMVKKSTSLIAVVVPDLINPIYMAITSGIEKTMREANYNTLVYSSNDHTEEELMMLNGITGRFVDGAIIVPASTNSDIYEAFQRPIVLVDRCCADWNLDMVVVDNYGGSYALAQHVIQRGHRNIGVINGTMEFNIGIERHLGIVNAMAAANIPVNPANIKTGTWFEETGYHETMEFLKRDDCPSAIIATNNLICMGCIQALYDQNIRIGTDISLAGFDENRLASFVNPKVTVISRPTVELGIVAAERLLEKLGSSGKDIIPRKNVLSTKLICGGSVKALS